jgi:hypothetical protein
MSKKMKKSPPPSIQTPKMAVAKKSTFFLSFLSKNALPLVILTILSFFIYGRSIAYDYVLDDKMVLSQNQFTQKGIDGIGDLFRYETFRGYFKEKKDYLEGDRYRPFSLATFAIERSFFGKNNPAISHFINILLYILTGFLIFRTLQLLFRPSILGGSISGLWSVPFLGALLFIVHPLHVEVVANIKGRDEIFAFLGAFGALWATIKYVDTRNIRRLFVSFLLFTIGIFSKESAITFAAIVPLILHFFRKETADKRTIFIAMLPIFLGTLIYLAARTSVLSGNLLAHRQTACDLMNEPFCDMNFAQKTATIFLTLGWYLKLHILPYPLTHDYYPYHVPKVDWSDWRAILGAMLHIGLVVLAIFGLIRRHIWGFAAAFYLICMSIVSNLAVSVGTFMNERFTYHASFAFCLALAYFLSNKNDENLEYTGGGAKKWKIWVASFFVFSFSVISFLRVPAWKNEETLNESAISVSHGSARANLFYGISIWQKDYIPRKKQLSETERRFLVEKMQPYFERAIQIVPNYNSAQQMWAGWAAEKYDLDKNLPDLLARFEQVNHGTLPPTPNAFVLQYAKYLDTANLSPADNQFFEAFCEQMARFFEEERKDIKTANEYRFFLTNAR